VSSEEPQVGILYCATVFEIHCPNAGCKGRALNLGSNIWFQEDLKDCVGQRFPCDRCGGMITLPEPPALLI
jgi:hypothetical protein